MFWGWDSKMAIPLQIYLKGGFKNLTQFFALPCSQQLAYLPRTMPKHSFDSDGGEFESDKPVEVLTFNLREHSRLCAFNAGFEGFEEIDESICDELFALCDLIIFQWDTYNENGQALSPHITWVNSTLETHDIWKVMRRLACIAVQLHGWELEVPKVEWEELIGI